MISDIFAKVVSGTATCFLIRGLEKLIDYITNKLFKKGT